MRLIMTAAISLIPGMVAISEFKFGNLSNEALTLPSSDDLAECSEFRGSTRCKLRRQSFGQVAIRKSEVILRKNRLIALHLEIALADHDKAFSLLKARYGDPDRLHRMDHLGTDALGRSRFSTSSQWAFGQGLLSIRKDDGDREKARIAFEMPNWFSLDEEPKKIDY